MFSVITPTFNRAHFISIAIESVLKQTFQDWELIIIDENTSVSDIKNQLKWNDSYY